MRITFRTTSFRSVFPLVALMCAAACTTQPAGMRVGVPGGPPYAGGELGPDDLGALGTRVQRLRVEPESLSLRVGETYSLGTLRVDALDLQGRRLGRFRIFDRGITYNGVLEMPGPAEIVAAREGTDTLKVSYPEMLWRGEPQARPRAFVVVHVVK